MATNQEANTLQGWGISVLAPVAEALANYSYSMSAFPSIIKDFVQVVIKLSELASSVSLGAEGENAVKARLSVINQGRSVLNAIMIDGEDDYSKSASSVAGLGDMIDRMMMQVAAVTGLPVSLLFGRAAQGMNATGQGDENIFNEFVASYQETDLSPLIEWIVGLVGKQATWTEGEDGLKWAWPDLAPIDEKDRADIKLKNAQTDNIYIQAGAVDATWIYQQRHQEVYAFDVNADPEEYEAWVAENVVGEQALEDSEEEQ
jgi:phage-related protein (TIGR01555 family)